MIDQIYSELHFDLKVYSIHLRSQKMCYTLKYIYCKLNVICRDSFVDKIWSWWPFEDGPYISLYPSNQMLGPYLNIYIIYLIFYNISIYVLYNKFFIYYWLLTLYYKYNYNRIRQSNRIAIYCNIKYVIRLNLK